MGVYSKNDLSCRQDRNSKLTREQTKIFVVRKRTPFGFCRMLATMSSIEATNT